MAMMWDPSTLGSDNENLFWTAQEWANGGPDQETEFVGLQDPLPFFAGSSIPIGVSDGGIGESDCGNTPLTCGMTFSAPAGAQFGDVLVAVMWAGESDSTGAVFNLPPGWTLLPLANLSNQGYLISKGAGFYLTSFIAAYVYGSQPNDSGQYTLSITRHNKYAEVAGILADYRGADTNFASYSALGYAGTKEGDTTSTLSVTPSAADQTLMTLFSDACADSDNENTESIWSFTAPSGVPSETAETLLSSSSPAGGVPFLISDTPVTTSGTYGPYSTVGRKGINFAYNLLIPE
ncbi:MAG TPA: hypothetical protein VKS22_00865 [Candidatus Binataceae bacterium]|nr:hypothetical protein [Candidatus Binataceae bacterium]